jgi:CRISPR/Cas system-associated endonuclease Cas1
VGASTTRPAATPINALLNYSYGLAEIECRLAAITVGLDPGMGIVHTDKRNRDSLALDLLEAIRPLVERNVLTLLATRALPLRSTPQPQPRPVAGRRPQKNVR